MFIMGTAGHIDHGKTTLITALSGINPDRLQEEQFRGMTVDLGFAWFQLPAGNVGVVDVPGHHRLIKNMLAGIGQIDFALLVIAADDGWMPQTQEHLEILHLYGVKSGLVALTKADLVDRDWLELVEEDIREHLAGTNLATFPILPVSAVSGLNMDALKQAINELLLALQRERTEEGDDPLLWVDRVFTIRGAGTVVTGTLLGGPLVVGTEIVAQPSGKRARIRGLQTQTQIVEKGTPHSRLAVNLSGIEKTDLKRGMYLALPNRRPSYSLLNASVQILPNAPAPLESEQLVKLYVGSLETLAQVRILGDSKLDPGKQGYVQLELESPAHFAFGDRFLLRHSELQDNLGGGQFIEEGIPVRGQKLRLVGPKRRQHLFPFEKPAGFLDLANLKKKSAADPETLSLLRAADRTFWTKAQWTEQGLKLHPNLAEFGAYVLAPRQLSKLQDFLLATVQKYHKTNPLETGPSKETLRAATGVPARLFDQIIEKMPGLQEIKGAICSTDHQVTLSAEEERQLQDLLARIENTPYEPPNMATLLDWGFTRELVFAGAHLGHLAPLANEHWTSPKILDSVLEVIFQEECFRDGFELAAFRDRFATSRKFALTFLEQFDSRGVTIRKGDLRLLGKDPRS